jgi:hypothetical protein
LSLLAAILRRVFPPLPLGLDDVAAGEQATVRGIVVPRDLIASPLSGEPCVYFRITIERWRRSRVAGIGGDGFWEREEQDEAIAEFYLQDGQRRAIVTPHQAQVGLGRGVAAQTRRLDDDRRGIELLIQPGDEVEVTGRIEEVADLLDDSRGYRASAARLLLRAPDDRPLAISLVKRAER